MRSTFGIALPRSSKITSSEGAKTTSAELPVSRQAISKHLAALAEVGLVRAMPVGREIRYRAIGSRLSEVATELDRIGAEWDARLDRIRTIAERL